MTHYSCFRIVLWVEWCHFHFGFFF